MPDEQPVILLDRAERKLSSGFELIESGPFHVSWMC